MSEEAELQAEEIEVLKSIYDGDENFKQLSSTTFQYKYVDGEKSFILEIQWGPKYPNEKPKFNMEIFYNQSLLQSVKDKIFAIVNEEADQWIGSAMTYTLFECLKEKVSELLAEQSEERVVSAKVEKLVIDDQSSQQSKKLEKKEHLTKAQKRRAWDRAEMGKAGEKPRGWDWVDVVKHLSQAPHVPDS